MLWVSIAYTKLNGTGVFARRFGVHNADGFDTNSLTWLVLTFFFLAFAIVEALRPVQSGFFPTKMYLPCDLCLWLVVIGINLFC